VASFTQNGTRLCAGHLAAAAQSLADRATSVAIVTGFAIVDAAPVAAETDGPPGALLLARALTERGVEVALITDGYGVPALEVGCDLLRLPRSLIFEFPLEEASAGPAGRETTSSPRADAWVAEFLASGPGSRLSHLIAIERVGPSHTSRSFLAQRREGAPPIDEFHSDLPAESRDVCHNMRGMPIDACTGRIHRLFEAVSDRSSGVTTIGVGDGGNEIGMGAIPWETLRSAITIGPGGRVACRVSTDYTLLAGVSDWAAFALAGTFGRLRGTTSEVCDLDERNLRALVEALVRDAGAVDGVTGRREPTVDGLPLETYLQVFTGIRTLCGDDAR